MRRGQRQQGFSLIELMIAMVIGLFLVSGLVYVYIGSKTSYNHNEGLSRLQENGRFAIYFLRQDLRQAGYQGCADNVGATRDTLGSSTNDYQWNFDVSIEGFDDVGTTWPAPLQDSLDSQTPIAGTDIITIRRAADDALRVTAHPGGSPPGSATVHVPQNNGVQQGDIVIVTNCQDAAIMQVTNANPDTSGQLVHNTGQGTPGNRTKRLGQNFANNGKVLQMRTITYYLAASNTTNTTIPSLWRKINDDPAEELVSGIENLQILYGEDTDATRTADQYVEADNVGDMDNVVSVRIAFLASTIDDVASTPVPYSFTVFGSPTAVTPNDRRLRREFLATVNLRNRTP